MTGRAGILVVAVAVAAGGCFSPEPKSLSSDSAPRAVPAIKDAAARNDRKAIPRLIEDLNDGDPAIRFAAITALQQMTGQTFDYRYYDDDAARRPAVARWRQWLADHP
ncbi:MAG: HEAT repeat domain-containing protein [Tepidisphaeraceae bacterium]|jgi:hypothetical protein